MSISSQLKLAGVFLSMLCFSCPAAAQDLQFLPIGGGYECVRYPNGNQYVVTAHNPDFRLVPTKDVTSQLTKEREQLRQKSQKVNELSRKFAAESASLKLKNQFKKTFAFLYLIFDATYPSDATVAERKEIIAQTKRFIKDRKDGIAGLLQRINSCKLGQIKPPKGGELVIPEVRLVGFKASNNTESYAGFILITAARKPETGGKPTGFNGCLKLYEKDGSVSGLYTGFGDEPCFGSPGRFQYATSACNAVIAKKQVGYPVQKAVGVGVSDDTLNNLISIAEANRPQAAILALPSNMSRDKGVALCDKFLNN